jgi:signal peptidase I
MKREVFPSNSDHPIWIEGKPQSKDSQILVTVSNQTGEHTALISHDSIVSSKAKLFVEAPIERIVTGADIWKRRILSWFKVGGYVLACVLMVFSALSFTGVVKARIVLTASMSPAIDPGDIILTASPDRLEPKIGSVVAYTAKRFNGDAVGVFSHRIIGGDANTGFIVKGDANPSPDVQKPLIPDINGVIFLVIPFIGRLLTREALFILVPCIFGFWLVIDALKNES